LSGGTTGLGQKILASRFLVWFGIISYPLYLWHWPLLSFSRIVEAETPSIAMRLVLVLMSIFLAWATYITLERPIRRKPIAQSTKITVILCISMLLVFITGVAIRKSDGFPSRSLSRLNGDVSTLSIGKDRDDLAKECGVPETEKKLFQFCLSTHKNNAAFAVLGDSKSEALYYGLARESTPNIGSILIGSVRPPSQDESSQTTGEIKNRLAFKTILDSNSIKVVVFVVALRNIFQIDDKTGFISESATLPTELLELYSRAITNLENAGKRVIFVIDNPTFPDPRSCISGGMTSSELLNTFVRRKENAYCRIKYTDHLAGIAPYRNFISQLLAKNPTLVVYDPSPLLCDTTHNECSVTRDGKFLYSYSDHISDYANSMIARDLLPIILKLRGS
jgi:hypothetical protein